MRCLIRPCYQGTFCEVRFDLVVLPSYVQVLMFRFFACLDNVTPEERVLDFVVNGLLLITATLRTNNNRA